MKIQEHRPNDETRRTAQPHSKRGWTTRILAVAMILALASTALAGTAFAQSSSGESSCAEKGKNVQCTEFGTIAMDTQRDIRGEPISVTTEVYLHTTYADQGARWVMFSVRNVTDDGPSPVTIGVKGFSTSDGDIVVTRSEQNKASEVNLWVDVLDLPTEKTISLELDIGATERGAFSLETLVLAFDRGYAPITTDNDTDASLFSFTLLGVNEETESTAGGGDDSFAAGNKLPSVGVISLLAVVGIACAVLFRRQRR